MPKPYHTPKSERDENEARFDDAARFREEAEDNGVPDHEIEEQRDWYNAHGLVDGEIPAGSGCPFFERCNLRTENCPHESQNNIRKDHGFSCACARAFAIILPDPIPASEVGIE